MNLKPAIQPRMNADERRCSGNSANKRLSLMFEALPHGQPITAGTFICVHLRSSAVCKLFQTERQLIIVPWSSVKYIEATAVPPAALPLGVIKGARIIESAETT